MTHEKLRKHAKSDFFLLKTFLLLKITLMSQKYLKILIFNISSLVSKKIIYIVPKIKKRLINLNFSSSTNT